jgi:hypothetical protein
MKKLIAIKRVNESNMNNDTGPHKGWNQVACWLSLSILYCFYETLHLEDSMERMGLWSSTLQHKGILVNAMGFGIPHHTVACPTGCTEWCFHTFVALRSSTFSKLTQCMNPRL